MYRFLLDSGIASDRINRRLGVDRKVEQATARGDRVGLCMPVVAELFAGIELSQSRELNLLRLRRALATATIWPFDRNAAEEYGRLFATLKRSGRPIPHIDIQIAAIALTLRNCTLVTKDKDFSFVPGLKIEDWSQGDK